MLVAINKNFHKGSIFCDVERGAYIKEEETFIGMDFIMYISSDTLLSLGMDDVIHTKNTELFVLKAYF